MANRRKAVKKHNAAVKAFRAEHGEDATEEDTTEAAKGSRTVASPQRAATGEKAASPSTGENGTPRNLDTPGSAGASWRPGR